MKNYIPSTGLHHCGYLYCTSYVVKVTMHWPTNNNFPCVAWLSPWSRPMTVKLRGLESAVLPAQRWRNWIHWPSSSNDGQERIPLPVVTASSLDDGQERNPLRSLARKLGACFVNTRTTERASYIHDYIVYTCACMLFGLGAHGKHVPVTHTRPVPLFIQPLPLSRRVLDSAVLPSYSCRNLYTHTSASLDHLFTCSCSWVALARSFSRWSFRSPSSAIFTCSRAMTSSLAILASSCDFLSWQWHRQNIP